MDFLTIAAQVAKTQEELRVMRVIALWQAGEISEGRAARMAGVGRLTLRDTWLEVLRELRAEVCATELV